MANWLYTDAGKVHRALFTQSDAEIDEQAAKLDAKLADGAVPIFTHQVFIDPAKYAITEQTDGWMTVVRVNLLAQRVSFLCKGPRGGGFISTEMISGWRTL